MSGLSAKIVSLCFQDQPLSLEDRALIMRAWDDISRGEVQIGGALRATIFKVVSSLE